MALELAGGGARDDTAPAVCVRSRGSRRGDPPDGGAGVLQRCGRRDPTAVARLIEITAERFGRLDILVNNASVRREVDFADLEYTEWREIMATTLDGAYLCSRAAMPHLVAAETGAIVNIGGMSAHTGATRRAHVIAAKMGLVGLTRALAHDLAKHHITVNCVAPGLIDTTRIGAEPAHHAGKVPPLGRKGPRRRSARSSDSCAGQTRATSRARRFTPTAGCSCRRRSDRSGLFRSCVTCAVTGPRHSDRVRVIEKCNGQEREAEVESPLRRSPSVSDLPPRLS